MGEENFYVTYKYILAAIFAWIVAQGLKYVFSKYSKKSMRTYRHLYISGGMPSAHSATVMAVSILIGLTEGFGTSIFALSLLLATIVMYDAMMVRRSVGEQGEVLIEMIKKSNKNSGHLPYFARGHKPIEVFCGAVLGCIVAIIFYILV